MNVDEAMAFSQFSKAMTLSKPDLAEVAEVLAHEVERLRAELAETKAENVGLAESHYRVEVELAAAKADLASLDAIVAENEFLRVSNRGSAEDLAVSAEQLAAAKAASACPVKVLNIWEGTYQSDRYIELRTDAEADTFTDWLRDRMKEGTKPEDYDE